MRPVVKSACPQINGKQKIFRPHSSAKGDLEANIDQYCSYCEIFSSDLEVEHVISQYQDASLKYEWNNFLLACRRCNGKDNKGAKKVDPETTHLPHRNNTVLSFTYMEGGYVSVNTSLSGAAAVAAEAMLNLAGLDKIPGNSKYAGHNANDTRWRHRRVAWELAVKYLAYFEAGKLSAADIVEFAQEKGFFSIWYAVFEKHDAVRALLISDFKGTAKDCFDAKDGFRPVYRNPERIDNPV